jgi:protein-S-isoprenylcysteine O-methyltransferase Ste14
MNAFMQRWVPLKEYLSNDLLGGPRVLSISWPTNLQKGGTLFFVLGLMVWFDNFTPTAWTYLALHGSYGLVWLLKDLVCPDPRFHKPVTFGSVAIALLLVLGPYWVAPTLMITQRLEQPAWVLCAASVLYVLGVVVMLGADAQKYYVLKARKGLITDGFFARTRNPNYLGEMMLYGAFAAITLHWLPWLVLLWVWSALFLPNMLRKDARMARHEGWADYVAKTGMLLPKLI